MATQQFAYFNTTPETLCYFVTSASESSPVMSGYEQFSGKTATQAATIAPQKFSIVWTDDENPIQVLVLVIPDTATAPVNRISVSGGGYIFDQPNQFLGPRPTRPPKFD